MNTYLVIVLAWAISLACAVWYGYGWGDESATNAAKAAYATALESAIKEAKQNAAIDAQALIDHERARQEVRTVFVDKVRTITETIHANPTGCTVPANYRLSINAAIDAANSPATPIDGKLPVDTKVIK